MKKNLTGFLCFLLAMTMLCVAFAGCGSDEKATEAPTEAKTEEATDDNLDENGLLKDSLPDNLCYNDVLDILCWTEHRDQVYITEEESTTSLVAQSVFERDETVAERLGVELNWILTNGDSGARNNIMSKVETSVNTMGSADAYDAIVCYNLFPYEFAMRGLIQNLYGAKYLDLTAPWWPQSFINEVLMNDKLYTLVELGGRGTIKNVHCMFFNNDLLETYEMDDPYELVENNEWTLDKVAEMVRDTYNDLNNNGADGNDFYGFCACGTDAKIDAWIYAMGYRFSEVDGDGNLVSLLGSKEISDYLDYITSVIADPSIYLYEASGHHGQMFYENRCVFYMTSFQLADLLKNGNYDINYGIAPIPKKSSEQSRYYTHIANTHDAWSVPVNCDELDRSSALLECMSSEAYRQVMPVYFYDTLKVRYAPDERLASMYDLVLSSITFDFVYLYSYGFATQPKEQIKIILKNPQTTSWSSVYGSYGVTWGTEFGKIIDFYNN